MIPWLLNEGSLSEDYSYIARKAMTQGRIYKYFRLKKAGEKILDVDALENSYIYASSPSSFNDPFDCSVQADLDMTPQSYEQYCKIGGLKEWEIIARLKSFFNCDGTLNDHGLNEQESLVAQINSLNQGLGVSCFSKHPYNPLMWAHYANDHTGFCLELKLEEPFETKEYEDGVALHLFSEVKYAESSSLPKVTLKDFSDKTINALKLITEKGSRWEYEEESRLIINLKSDEDRKVKYNPDVLTGIYYGLDIDIEVKKNIRNITSPKAQKIFYFCVLRKYKIWILWRV